jgi:hypothetical protein
LSGASAPKPASGPPERDDDDVLAELRERFSYGTKAAAKIREEGRKDIQCVAGEPWQAMDPDGLGQRNDAHRPALALDELGQYVNQIINNVRQNKRAVKVTPIGRGASDKTAELRQNLIRQIEYRSNAQQQVYSPIFEDAVQRSYGYGRVKAQRVSDTSRDYELILEGFPNPDLVTVDPDDVTPTARGIQWAFIHESRSIKQFRRDFPDADVTDFTDELRRVAPDWIKDERVMLAEYWTIETSRRQVLFLKADPAVGIFADTFPEGMEPSPEDIDEDHWVDAPYVCQYLTNGVELLAKKGQNKRTAWPGKWIPVFACYGKQLYVNTGAGTERRLLSMVRLARDPFMLYNYYRTCQAELVGMVPKFPYFWYEGSLDAGQQVELQKSLHEPVAGIKVKPFPEGFSQSSGPAPFPQRQPFTPEIQALEMGAEGARRAIQAAMGTSPLPTQAQRQNEKSGKALKQIEDSGQKGSFHFVDHHDAMIVRVGEILNDLIPHYYDAKREITVRQGDDQSEQVSINDPDNPEAVSLTEGEHDVTIDVGPEYASQREAASEFADTVISNTDLAGIIGAEKFTELLGLAFRLKSAGPIVSEMADIIAPKKDDEQGPPTPQQMQELQARGQQLQQQNQELTQAIQTDQAKQAAQVEIAKAKAEADALAKQADTEVKWRIAQLEAETALKQTEMQEATKLQIAEYTLRGKEIQAEIDKREQDLGIVQKEADLSHQETQAAQDREHESAEAQASREAAEAQQAAGLSHEAQQAELARQAAAEQAASAEGGA